jgi:hypothetical protein
MYTHTYLPRFIGETVSRDIEQPQRTVRLEALEHVAAAFFTEAVQPEVQLLHRGLISSVEV